MKYPPLTTAALVSYNNLGPFSEVVPAEKMAELENRYKALLKIVCHNPMVKAYVEGICEKTMSEA